MIPLSEVRLARRKLEMTIAAGFGLLQITKKGKDVTGQDVLKAGAITGLTMGAILAQDKLLQMFVQRGWLSSITGTLIAIELAYIGGAVVSTMIDEDEGFENYNDFIDAAVDPDTAHLTDEVTAWSLAQIYLYYSGGGKDTGYGFFEYN